MMACTGQDAAARKHPLSRGFVGIGVVGERFFTDEPQDVGRQWDALRVALAFVEIDDQPHDPTFRPSATSLL